MVLDHCMKVLTDTKYTNIQNRASPQTYIDAQAIY